MNLTDTQMSLLRKIVSMYESGVTSSFIIAPSHHGTQLVCGPFTEQIDGDELDFRQLESEGLITLVGAWNSNLIGKPTRSGMAAVRAGFKLADRETAKLDRETDKSDHGSRFPTPSGTGWQEISIRFIDGHTLTVTIGSESRRLTYTELGMKDNRNGNPNSQWKLLLVFAQNGGRLSWRQSAAEFKKKKQVELLAHRLQEFFGIAESPFHAYQKGIGWQFKAHLEWLR